MKNNENTSVECIEIPAQLSEAAELPSYGSAHASGADARAYIKEKVIIPAGGSVLIPTGIRVALPEGYEIQLRPRSGLALKNQITVLNSPGTVDADYRGEIGVILINHGKEPFTVEPGMRIAQIVVARYVKGNFIIKDELSNTARGSGGFGHTGLN